MSPFWKIIIVASLICILWYCYKKGILLHETNLLKPQVTLTDISKILPLTKKEDIIRVYNWSKPLTRKQHGFHCPLMTSRPQVNICVYPTHHLASTHVLEKGVWEPEIGNLIMGALEGTSQGREADTGLIDIGASIGVHTIPAAKAGYPVVAVEPALENIYHLHASFQINNFLNNGTIIIVHNALADKRQPVKAYPVRESRYNPTALQSIIHNDNNKRRQSHANHVTEIFHSILLDDLNDVITFKKAVMKIDIEGAEPMMFTHAQKLFNEVNITDVFMEWGYSLKDYYLEKKQGEEGVQLFTKMVDFFYENNYLPWTSDLKPERLQRSNLKHWPWDMRWIKN